MLERQVAAIVWRTYAQAGLEEMARGTRVPVVNALSDDFHPCQLLADLLTIREHMGELTGLTLAFFGDGARTWRTRTCSRASTAGMHVRVASPEAYAPRDDVVADADRRAAETGGSVTLYTDANEAVAGADVVVTDTWVSMGKEEEKARRACATSASTRSTPDLMALAAPEAIFIHCLPADRGYEVDGRRDRRTAAASSGTRRRTACTPRRRCWSGCSARTERPTMSDGAPSRSPDRGASPSQGASRRLAASRPRGSA